VEGYLAASSLRAVIAQRLVRRICDVCSADYEPDVQESVLLESVMDSRDLERIQFKMGKGCQHCNQTGYRGRIGVFEILEINGPMADALRNNDTAGFTKAAIASPGFKPLIYAALEYAEKGIISVEEVFRVAEEVDEAQENIEAGIVEPSL